MNASPVEKAPEQGGEHEKQMLPVNVKEQLENAKLDIEEAADVKDAKLAKTKEMTSGKLSKLRAAFEKEMQKNPEGRINQKPV